MGVRRIDPDVAMRHAVKSLDLDPDRFALESPEVLAAAVRRTASFLCPTTPGALTRSVSETVSRLGGSVDVAEDVASMVESLASYGDLLELAIDDGTRTRRQLFLGPPAYVSVRPDCALLVGIRPDGAALVSDEVLSLVEPDRHTRRVSLGADAAIADLLAAEGLIEMHVDHWLGAPRRTSAEAVVQFYTNYLEAAGPTGPIDGLLVIDPSARVTYYIGRWRPLGPRDTGHFVARRPQAYGANAWCFADVRAGEVQRLIDLPIEDSLARPSDEAWRLQAALDVRAGRPQEFRVRVDGATRIIDVFSPVPSWLRRRIDVVGTDMSPGMGALFSYAVPMDALLDEISYLEDSMWLAQSQGGSDSGE
ncbi:hypothetical protein [Filomicrobium sp.]|uniref:hypothetical protein n=1 Tax=Filomicrobium sp. TaxID=2024831 RepID=UPI002585FC7B|nr:hypothetical protein [Filomicrobium sp.]MCV0371877.1 hypothetical protein [Filomicrobium sp.]